MNKIQDQLPDDSWQEERRRHQDLEEIVWKKIGKYLLELVAKYKIRFHIIEMDRKNKKAIATILPCCRFQWENHLVTPSLIQEIEQVVISNLDFINNIEWSDIESFYGK